MLGVIRCFGKYLCRLGAHGGLFCTSLLWGQQVMFIFIGQRYALPDSDFSRVNSNNLFHHLFSL